jgi:hypothetical protein
MPVADYLAMLCQQFLDSCLRPSHPSHEVVLLPPGPRKNKHGHPLKEMLSSKFTDSITHHLSDGIVPEVSSNRIKSAIHTDAVRASVAAVGVNPVLGCVPPPVHPSELYLPRIYQTTLSQLRSGKCSNLRNYQFFINPTTDDVCPNCHLATHSTNHLFACQAQPTALTVFDLWLHPVRAADFIRQELSVSLFIMLKLLLLIDSN